MFKKTRGTGDRTVINAAALQDHILRTANFSLKPLAVRPVVQFKTRESSSGKIRLPKLDNKFAFNIEEQQVQKEQVQLQQAYVKKLTLAQKLGLVAAPPKPMTLEEWEDVEEQSKQREEGMCPICLEPFKNQEHMILSCSHVFHRACLESFEKHSKQKVCPICRRQDYEKKRYVHAHKQYAMKSAIRIQSFYRGYVVRIRFYEGMLAQGFKPTSVRLRRRLMFYKLSKVTAKMQKHIDKNNKKTTEQVDILNEQLQIKKNQMDQQIQQIRSLKEQTHEQCLEILDKNQNEKQGKLQEEDWKKVKEKALKRCDKDCIICYQPLNNKKGVYILSCTHVFHAACINAFERYSTKQYQTCPVCRSEYEKLHMVYK